METVKTTLKIDGMACGMCEAHVSDVIRRAVPGARKVMASHKKGEASFVTDAPADAEALKRAFEPTGYLCLSLREEPFEEKKGLFRRR